MSVGGPIPQCWWCEYFDTKRHSETLAHVKIEFKCKAFPDEIPDEIFGDRHGPTFDHREPHPNDNGIQFRLPDDLETLSQRLPFRRSNTQQIEGELRHLHNLIGIGRVNGYVQPPFRKSDVVDNQGGN